MSKSNLLPVTLVFCFVRFRFSLHMRYVVNLKWRSRSIYSRLSGLLSFQGRVVENISKRCGGFLRKLSLRGCLGVGDSALR